MKPPPAAALEPAAIAARSRSNFLIGFRSLDAGARAAITAVYAFCRVADDAVDDVGDAGEAAAQLAFWRGELDAEAPATPVGKALRAAVHSHGVDPAHLRLVLDGVAMDLQPPQYQDLAALEQYCHRVAAAVGLACLPIMGVRSAMAQQFAERLGLALQLTNILRDLRSDAQAGRIYAPRRWLADCGVEPAWLAGGGPPAVYAPGGPVARLCARLAAAAAMRFQQARAALRQLPAAERRRLLPARVMGAVYAALLQRLSARGGRLDLPRARVPRLQKLWLLATLRLGLRR